MYSTALTLFVGGGICVYIFCQLMNCFACFFFFFFLNIYLLGCGACVPCENQITTCGSCFFLSTMCILGIKFRLLGLAASAFYSLSHFIGSFFIIDTIICRFFCLCGAEVQIQGFVYRKVFHQWNIPLYSFLKIYW